MPHPLRIESRLLRTMRAVAEGSTIPRVARLVAAEAAALTGAASAGVVRFTAGDGVPVAVVARPRAAEPGGRSLAVPVLVDGRPWGALVVELPPRRPASLFARRHLERLAEAVALAVAVHTRHERMLAEAHSDELTGIANRRAFGRRLSSEVERARRYGHHLSLVLIDLDRFKGVNEAHGHQVGDEVLAETARRLSALVRRGELVARIGGDELAWLLPETDEAAAAHAADRARSAIARSPFPAAGPLTISAGVADLARAGTPEELVRLADMALMRAKREGRGITRRAAAGA